MSNARADRLASDAFDVFISCRHESEAALARGLHAALEQMRARVPGRRSYRTLPDASVEADPHAWSQIHHALARSRVLLLLASPASARSPVVHQEVTHFLGLEGNGREH